MLRALEKLVSSKRAGGAWIRVVYAYPSCFPDEMIRTLGDCGHVVKYIDMPLQHINDGILRTMRRKVTRGEIEGLLEKLRKWVPGIALRTTLIAGFPTETEAQHAELLRFVEEFRFDNLGVFEFSPEPGTAAGRLHGEAGVPAEVAARRKEELMLAQQRIVFAKNAGLVGRAIGVLVDAVNPRKRTAAGRHGGQAPDIDGSVVLEKCGAGLAPGEFVTARVTGYKDYDLVAAVDAGAWPCRAEGGRPTRGQVVSLPVIGGAKPGGRRS